jgi:hypothetical protein
MSVSMQTPPDWLNGAHRPSKALNLADRVVVDVSGAERAVAVAPPHLKPLFQAMCDSNAGVLFIGREAPPRLFQTDRVEGGVVLVSDDRRKYRYRVDGPEAYDRLIIAQ